MVNITRNIAANPGLGLRYAFMFKFRKVAISKGDSTGISSFTVSQLSLRERKLCTIGGCVCMGLCRFAYAMGRNPCLDYRLCVWCTTLID